MTLAKEAAPLLRPYITVKGLAAANQAATLGKAVKITKVGLTATTGTAKPEDTTLPGAKMVNVADGRVISEKQVNISALLPDTFPSMDIAGVAFYLEDGTMFAIYRENQPFLEHTTGTTLLVGMDFAMDNIPSESVIVESTGANLIMGDWVPVQRKVCGKALSVDIYLSAADVGALPEHGFGLGGKQGNALDAKNFTEDKSMDFNKLLTAGEYTVTGNWLNGYNNVEAAQVSTGQVKVQVRHIGGGASYIQTFSWVTGSNTENDPYQLAEMSRVGIGTYPNIQWLKWKPSGTWEQSLGYRLCIDREGTATYPYITLNKRAKNTNITSGFATIGLLDFRHGEMSDVNNPASAKMAAQLVAETAWDQSENRISLALRDPANNTVAMLRMEEQRVILSSRNRSLVWDGEVLSSALGRYTLESFF
ncbi:MAG: hypothetical protein ACRC8R_12255, partial [Aeromonas hydrophila]